MNKGSYLSKQVLGEPKENVFPFSHTSNCLCGGEVLGEVFKKWSIGAHGERIFSKL